MAVVGVVSNAAALFVLRRELVQRTFHLLMMFLAAWDAAYLVLSVAWDVCIRQVYLICIRIWARFLQIEPNLQLNY